MYHFNGLKRLFKKIFNVFNVFPLKLNYRLQEIQMKILTGFLETLVTN